MKTELQILKEPEEAEEEERVTVDIDDEDLGFDDTSQSLKQDVLFWTPTGDLLQLQQPVQQAAQFQQLDQVEQSAQAEQSVPQFLQPKKPPAVKRQSRLEQFLSPKVFRTVSRLKGLQSQSIIPQGTSQMMLPQATAQPTSQLGLPQPTSQLGLPQTPSQMMLQGTAQGLASGVSQSMMQVFPQGVLQSVPQGSKAMYVRSQQASRKKGESKLRTSTAGPVPERLRDPRRKYCEQCPANYSRKDQLTHHENFNCLHNVKDFICDECEKEYFSDTTLMEHYGKVHLKKFLYFCKKCNQGFHHKSNRSSHRNACPNKDGPDQYPGMLDIDPELEKKFRRCRKIQVEDVPESVMKIAEEQEAMDAVPYEHSESQSQSQSQPPTSTFIPTAEDRKVMEEEEEEQ